MTTPTVTSLGMAVTSPDYMSVWSRAMAERLELYRALQGGTRTMREATTVFLPMHPRESQEHYDRRLAGSFLFNVFERAVKNMADKPFSVAPSIENVTDADLDAFTMSIDGRGSDVQTFGRLFLAEALRTGVCFIVADMPVAPKVDNLAQERALGLRPYAVLIRADQVLEARYTVTGGRQQLTHFRYLTIHYEPDGEFGQKIVRRITVLEPGRWRSYSDRTVGGTGTSFSPEQDGWQTMSVKRVPVIRVQLGEEDQWGLVRSPFEDLAWKNVEHWQSSSDQRNILRYGRFPMLAAKGYKPQRVGDVEKPLEIGPSKILVTPPEGEFYYVEPEGKAIAAGENDLTRIESQMEYLALRPRVDKRSVITATGAAIEEVDENNVVRALALVCGNIIEELIILAGQWIGRDWSQVSVSLNGDFEVSSDRAQSIETVLRMLDGGKLSDETALEELKALGVFRSRFDVKKELEAIAEIRKRRMEEQAAGLRPEQMRNTQMGLQTNVPGEIPSTTNT